MATPLCPRCHSHKVIATRDTWETPAKEIHGYYDCCNCFNTVFIGVPLDSPEPPTPRIISGQGTIPASTTFSRTASRRVI